MIAEYISDQTGAHVTGIDMIAQVIEDAQARTQDKRKRLAFLVMDTASLELPSAAKLDVVIAIDTLYFGDAHIILQPVIPLLRPAPHCCIFRPGCPPNTLLEDYPRNRPCPIGTDLAQALQRLGLPYRTWDYTAQMRWRMYAGASQCCRTLRPVRGRGKSVLV